MEWNESVDALDEAIKKQSARNKLSPAVIVNALTGWLETELTSYTEGSYEAVARRVVWVFPNKYSLTLGTSIEPTIACIDKDLNDGIFNKPVPFECMDNTKWYFDSSVNGWVRHTKFSDEETAEFIALLTKENGPPYLALPWERKVQNFEDDGDDWADWVSPEDDKYELYQTYGKLLNLFTEKNISSTRKTIMWDVRIVDEDEDMSDFCYYSRFMRFAFFLEEQGWAVILDEHCAACASGTRKWMQEQSEDGKPRPEFLTWGQNSDTMYYPDGNMSISVYISDETDERYVKEQAADFGLWLGDWEDPDFECEEEILFDSL